MKKRNITFLILILCLVLGGCGLSEEREHSKAVKNDTNPPVISGLEEGETVEADYGQEFNLEKFLDDTLSIEDDVSGTLTQYSFSISDKIMTEESADIDTTKSGDYPVSLAISDEAGNEAVLNFTLKINRFHITKDNPNPIVYEGEYGKVILSDIRYGTEAGITGYHFTFHIVNNSETEMAVFLDDAYINNVKISAYTDISSIDPGREGTMESNIRDEDMTPEMDGFTQIEADICIASSVMMGETYTSIPVTIDRNIAN